MVTKPKVTSTKKKGQVKVRKLNLQKETVRELSKQEGKEIKGGQCVVGKNSATAAFCMLPR